MSRWVVFLWVGWLIMLGSNGMAQERDLLGDWLHESEPVTVTMQETQQASVLEGVVARHATNPNAIGKQLFRGLQFVPAKNCWQGEVYVNQLEEHKPICISFVDDNTFEMTVKVGFFSKTVQWNRQ